MKHERIKCKISESILLLGVVTLIFCGGCAATAKQIADTEQYPAIDAEKIKKKPEDMAEISHPAHSPDAKQEVFTKAPVSDVSVDWNPENMPGPSKTVASPQLDKKQQIDKKQQKNPETIIRQPDEKSEKEADPEMSAGSEDSSAVVESVVFNFDNASLRDVIRKIAEHLQINYMFDVAVDGKITIYTAGELKKKDIWPLFYQILEANGLTAVQKDQLYHVVNLKNAARLPITSYTDSAARIPANENFIIQIIPLQNISDQEMVKLLTPFISESGQIISHEQSNTLVVVDNRDNMSKILKLAETFDADIFEKMGHRFFSLQYGDVESIVVILNKIFSSFGPAIQADANFVPITRLNTLLVISSNSKIFDETERLIKKYDVPSQSTEPGIYVYSLKNGRAADIAGILNNVFTGKKKTAMDKDQSGESESVYRNPLAREAKAKAKAEETDQPATQKEKIQSDSSRAENDITAGSGTLKGDINITADESRNALILEAAPSDYQIIKNLLTKLDIMPRQVLIEVTLAEVSLDESTSMGVEWAYVKGNANMSTSLLNAKMGNSGLNVTVGNPDRWTAVLSALATENKVNILSRPSVLASNSIPAKIDVSQEIPVASSQYEYTSGDNPMVSTDIEYRDTGIMLSVTPNINEQGLVTMDVSQEISEQASNVSVGGKDYPSFFKRNTETTLTVQSGQTIVIGGLIRETKTDGASGMPWFTNIPVLGFLFGKTSDSINKTELIILISPYVIDSPDDVDAITQEFSRKIGAFSLYSE